MCECVRVCLFVCRMPLLVAQVSLSVRVCVCVVYQLVRRRCRGHRLCCGVCGLISSLYSNDRLCCFTCCGRRSPRTSPPPSEARTQALLPVGITWVSPYVWRPSTHRLEQQSSDQLNCVRSCFEVSRRSVTVSLSRLRYVEKRLLRPHRCDACQCVYFLNAITRDSTD